MNKGAQSKGAQDVEEIRERTAVYQPRIAVALASRALAAATALAMLGTNAIPAAEGRDAALPATTAGRLLGEWLQLCDAPNSEQMRMWLAQNLSEQALQRVPAADRAQSEVETCARNGGFRIARITHSEPNDLSLQLVGLASDVWFEKRLELNAAGKVDHTSQTPTAPFESAQPKDLSDAAITQDVQRTVAVLSRQGLFSGIVTVARGSKVIVSASAGDANRTSHAAITENTQFTLGSIGKIFTATAIGQLVDQHRLSFQDTVGKFFPEYPNKTVHDKVTVGMLLCHTAGLGDFLDKRTPEMMQNGVTRASDFMPLYDRDEPRFDPGTQWSYSNAGLALAGAIVEKVSGEDYPNYIRRHVFTVAGMTHSDPNNVPHQSNQMATPYTRMTAAGRSTDWLEAPRDIGSPAGGALSSADDLIRFADALRGGRLLSRNTLAEMTRTHGPFPVGYKYGYALEIEEVYGRTLVGHSGGFPGVSTHLYMLLDSPYTIVVLSNQDPPADEYAGSQIAALIAEKAKRGM